MSESTSYELRSSEVASCEWRVMSWQVRYELSAVDGARRQGVAVSD